MTKTAKGTIFAPCVAQTPLLRTIDAISPTRRVIVENTATGGFMRRCLQLCSVLILISAFIAIPALAQVGKIVVNGVPDRYKSANGGLVASGLRTVAVGSRVVLSPQIFAGQGTKYSDTLIPVTSASWSFTSLPTGSTATITDTTAGMNGKVVYFIADSAGVYIVSMTPTPSASAAKDTIFAATYVGAGISVAQNSYGAPVTCDPCHRGSLAQNFVDWESTNHAQAVKRKANDPAQHFSNNCFSCHAIGATGLATHKNNGFDDMALLESFPSSILPDGPGKFDTLVAHYPKTMATTSIQCQNCHGPAGAHANTSTGGDPKLLDETLSNTACDQCHFSSDRHGIGYAWTGSAHANSTAEGSQVQYMDRFPCAKCHTAQGYIYNTIGGKAVPNNSGSVVSYANPMPVGCVTCHDPHKNNHPTDIAAGAYTYPQLRVNEIGDACVGCHQTRISSRGLHTAGQGSMLIGADATPFTLANLKAYKKNSSDMSTNVGLWSGWEFPGYTYANSSHSAIEDRCVTCHMAQSPSNIVAANSNYTIPDTMLNKLGGHTFRVAYTAPGDSVTVLNPTGCTPCHGTVTMDFVELTQTKANKLLAALATVLPKRDSIGTVISFYDTVTYQGWKNAPTKRALTTTELAAAYNYQFVVNDGSYGVHNFTYTQELLNSSIEQLQLGTGTANIAQIKDVPGDNGKDVQVVWNEFPAENASYNKVISYGVWRQDPMLPVSGSSAAHFNSYSAMIKGATVGNQYVMGTSVWTFVASVPASNQAQYSYIAPTLFDSTKTSGMKYSVFYISGHTSDPSYVYKSAVDSGYSVNNLFPLAPSGVAAKSNAQGITLVWDPPTQRDNDVVQYAIYRGTTPNFTPTSTLASVKLVTTYLDASTALGSTYYYRIAAIDNAGNIGALSNEISLKATDVEEITGLPTDYTLEQNYPNPFNPSTQIGFSLPTASYVKVDIYNVSGELIRTLANDQMSAGIYRLTWNATDNAGRSVSSGVYIYHIQADKFVASRKMLLLR
jgi:hypothetical protein